MYISINGSMQFKYYCFPLNIKVHIGCGLIRFHMYCVLDIYEWYIPDKNMLTILDLCYQPSLHALLLAVPTRICFRDMLTVVRSYVHLLIFWDLNLKTIIVWFMYTYWLGWYIKFSWNTFLFYHKKRTENMFSLKTMDRNAHYKSSRTRCL